VKFGSNGEECEIQPKREENGRSLLRLSGAFFDGSDGEQRADFPQTKKDQ